MSRRISQMMDQPEYMVKKIINTLEDKNGYPSHDVRLLAESIQKIRVKLNDLGLDPDDTTGQELYQALLAKFIKDSQAFDNEYGTDLSGFDQKTAKAAQLLSKSLEMPRQWFLKKSIAKDILRQQPPKRVMKALHYRSVESMLKREDLAELFLASQYIESATWRRLHSRAISKLDQTAFELRSIALASLSYDNWVAIAGPGNHIAEDNSLGAIGLWPVKRLSNLSLLGMLVLLTDTLNDYTSLNVGRSLADLSQTVSWWADMDHLVAELGSEHVSLSLKDCAQNSLNDKHYDERQLDHGRTSFWKELLSRYENQLPSEGLFDTAGLQRAARLKLAVQQPAFEEVEDI